MKTNVKSLNDLSDNISANAIKIKNTGTFVYTALKIQKAFFRGVSPVFQFFSFLDNDFPIFWLI